MTEVEETEVGAGAAKGQRVAVCDSLARHVAQPDRPEAEVVSAAQAPRELVANQEAEPRGMLEAVFLDGRRQESRGRHVHMVLGDYDVIEEGS